MAANVEKPRPEKPCIDPVTQALIWAKDYTIKEGNLASTMMDLLRRGEFTEIESAKVIVDNYNTWLNYFAGRVRLDEMWQVKPSETGFTLRRVINDYPELREDV